MTKESFVLHQFVPVKVNKLKMLQKERQQVGNTRLHFQKQEKALEEARKRKKETLQTGKSKTKDSTIATKLNEDNTSISESCSNRRPVRVATRKALESIGKVTRYESQINDMIGSIASFSDNDEDDDFNIEFSDASVYDSTSISPSSPQVPTLPPPPKCYYHPSTHNQKLFAIAEAVEENEKLGSINTNVSIHSHVSDDESSNSDFLPLTILRQSLVPKLPSPLKFYHHPTGHKKGNSEQYQIRIK